MRALARARAALVVAAGAAVLAACTAQPMPTPTVPSATPTPLGDGVLRIGTLVPSSGASAGPAQVAGVHAAVREINAAGGVGGAPVEVLNRDSGDGDGARADESFADLVARGVDVVIGPSSSELAERLLPAAEAAGVVLISPAASAPRLTELDGAGMLFRTIPHDGAQGAVLADLLAEEGAETVAIVHGDDEAGLAIAAGLERGLADGGELIAVALGADAEAAAAAAAGADAVVLATPDAGDATRAVLGALLAAGVDTSRVWLTGGNLADYSHALPAGTLDGMRGIRAGVEPDDAFRAVVQREDPGVADLRFAAEAYDATVLAALAAIQARDDAGVSIAAALRPASVGGIPCTSFGECLAVLEERPDIDYDGITGVLNLDPAGDRTRAVYGIYSYDAENRYHRSGSRTG